MERVTFEEYEAAKAAVLYGKEYEETSSMENNVIHKQYVCKDGREAAGRGVEYKAFEMYFMQGMDYAEIAEELDTGKNTPRRWVTGIINELSVLLWGIDEERVK